MKNYWTKAAWMTLAVPMLLTACNKNDKGQLDGPVPQPTFTITTQQVGITTVATFTNTTTYTGPGIVQYEWDFGDGSTAAATTTTTTHVYAKGGTVQPQLLASARGGNGFSDKKDLILPDVATLAKQLLTGGSSKTWVLQSDTVATITVGPSDSDPRSYYAGGPANSLPACQADDEYTFSNANSLTYDAKAQTLVAGATGCSDPRSYTSAYTFGPAVGSGFAQLDLQKAGAFIGVTDAPDMTYRITKITATRMTIRAGKSTSNLVFEMKFKAK